MPDKIGLNSRFWSTGVCGRLVAPPVCRVAQEGERRILRVPTEPSRRHIGGRRGPPAALER